MSGLYHRQVAPTRSRGSTTEQVHLPLARSELARLIVLAENDVAVKKCRRAAGEVDFGLEAMCLILDRMKAL